MAGTMKNNNLETICRNKYISLRLNDSSLPDFVQKEVSFETIALSRVVYIMQNGKFGLTVDWKLHDVLNKVLNTLRDLFDEWDMDKRQIDEIKKDIEDSAGSHLLFSLIEAPTVTLSPGMLNKLVDVLARQADDDAVLRLNVDLPGTAKRKLRTAVQGSYALNEEIKRRRSKAFATLKQDPPESPQLFAAPAMYGSWYGSLKSKTSSTSQQRHVDFPLLHRNADGRSVASPLADVGIREDGSGDVDVEVMHRVTLDATPRYDSDFTPASSPLDDMGFNEDDLYGGSSPVPTSTLNDLVDSQQSTAPPIPTGVGGDVGGDDPSGDSGDDEDGYEQDHRSFSTGTPRWKERVPVMLQPRESDYLKMTTIPPSMKTLSTASPLTVVIATGRVPEKPPWLCRVSDGQSMMRTTPPSGSPDIAQSLSGSSKVACAATKIPQHVASMVSLEIPERVASSSQFAVKLAANELVSRAQQTQSPTESNDMVATAFHCSMGLSSGVPNAIRLHRGPISTAPDGSRIVANIGVNGLDGSAGEYGNLPSGHGNRDHSMERFGCGAGRCLWPSATSHESLFAVDGGIDGSGLGEGVHVLRAGRHELKPDFR